MTHEFFNEEDDVDGGKDALASEFMMGFIRWTKAPANTGYRHHVLFVVLGEDIAAVEIDCPASYALGEDDDSSIVLPFLWGPCIKVSQNIGFSDKCEFPIAVRRTSYSRGIGSSSGYEGLG